MSTTPPIVAAPAGYVPEHAIAFGTAAGPAIAVDQANPLPTVATLVAAASAALTGAFTDNGTAGPFTPQLGRALWVTLSGSWTGTAQLLRSTDGGATRLPLTYGDGTPKGVWTANVQAPIAEETVAAATYYLQFARNTGTLAYRVEQ